MSTVNGAIYGQLSYQSIYGSEKSNLKNEEVKKDSGTEETKAKKTEEGKAEKKIEVKGPGTYGNPELSEKALDYYNSLKKKYKNLNFVLVASDKKQEAEMMKGSFANASALTVLIDTDKIERMAEDEAYRAKYETILDNAATGLSQFKTQLGSKADSVKAFGMSFNKDGKASFFAVVDKSLAAQRERIEKNAEKKKEAKKAEAKKAQKEKNRERLEERKKADGQEEETVTITADSPEELVRKLDEYYQQELFSVVRTDEEKAVGSRFDFSI